MIFGFGFCSVLYRVRFDSGSCTFFLLSGSVRFLAKHGFWFGSFLLGSDSFPSLKATDEWSLYRCARGMRKKGAGGKNGRENGLPRKHPTRWDGWSIRIHSARKISMAGPYRTCGEKSLTRYAQPYSRVDTIPACDIRTERIDRINCHDWYVLCMLPHADARKKVVFVYSPMPLEGATESWTGDTAPLCPLAA